MADIISLPLTMFSLNCSFSHEAKDAFSASVIFLLVPGVRGGTWVGISGTKATQLSSDKQTKQNKLRGLSPRANYTDRAAAAGRRS